jgi:hypothetical protein
MCLTSVKKCFGQFKVRILGQNFVLTPRINLESEDLFQGVQHFKLSLDFCIKPFPHKIMAQNTETNQQRFDFLKFRVGKLLSVLSYNVGCHFSTNKREKCGKLRFALQNDGHSK